MAPEVILVGARTARRPHAANLKKGKLPLNEAYWDSEKLVRVKQNIDVARFNNPAYIENDRA